MIQKTAYYDLLPKHRNEDMRFAVTANQAYLYVNKVLQPWHKFAKSYYSEWRESVLEVGCGNGALIEKIQAKKKIGLDLDESASALVDRALAEVRNQSLEAFSEVPENRGAFDVVFAFEVIEHFPDPVKFVEGCNVTLKRGGYVVGSTPNSKRWWLILFKREEFDFPPNHFVTFDRHQLRRLFEANGFETVIIGPAFVLQNWRHVFYRLSAVFGKQPCSHRKLKYCFYTIAVLASPFFAIMNVLPGRYLHHGFVFRKR